MSDNEIFISAKSDLGAFAWSGNDPHRDNALQKSGQLQRNDNSALKLTSPYGVSTTAHLVSWYFY